MAEGLLSTARRRWKGLMGDVESLSQGLGSGLASQVDSITGLIESPVETSRQMYQGVKALAQNPSVIPGLLRDAYQGATSGPMGFGEFVGANVGLRPRTPKSLLDMTVYHGSPHDFDKFDMSKIGTGEGAQAYGHGLYVAENPDVAKQYKTAGLQPQNASLNARSISTSESNINWLNEIAGGKRPRPLRRDGSPVTDEWIQAEIADNEAVLLKAREWAGKNKPSLYTVDLPDSHIANMLDWDAPLSQQPESVRKAIAGLGVTPESLGKVAAEKVRKMAGEPGVADWAKRDLLEEAARLESAKSIQQISGTLKRMPLEYGISRDSGPFKGGAADFLALVKATEYVPNMDTGGGAYGLLSALKGGDKAASELLRSYGSPGIKYLDGGSRTMTPPTVKMNSGKYEVYWGNDPRPVNTFPTKEAAEAAAREIDGRSRNFVVFDDKLLKILKKE